MLSIYAKPSSHVLIMRERAVVDMIGTVFTLVQLKIIPTIRNLICRCLIYVRCDAVRNCMFFRDSQMTGVSGWILIWGSSQELHVITLFLTGAR